MTTSAMPTTNRRGLLHLIAAGAGAYVIVRALSLPGVGEVITTDHAMQRHGLDAERVRAHFAAIALAIPNFFNRPPCHDNKWRYTGQLPTGEYCLWVLIRVGPRLWEEITAFSTKSQAYIKAVNDDCGSSTWLGHVYGG